MVIGGSYRSEDPHPNRNPEAMTMMYAGYEQELRNMMNNPTGIFSPRWTSTYLGTRLLVVLFWFLVSLGFTAAMPGTISRGVARLQLTSLRVAVIGLIGLVVLFGAVPLCLWIMPEPVQAMVGLLALLLLARRWSVWQGHSLRRHRPLVAKKISRRWKKFRGCGVITRDKFLGTLNLAPLRLALYGSFYADYQLRAGIDGALPRRLE